jgi:pimeloyl-ACP methyl ester carboxylesterase
VRIFASEYPEDVVGIVLVDPRLEELSTHPYFAPTRSDTQLKLWELLARLGFFRAIGRNMLPAPYQEKMPDYPVEIMITPRYFELSLVEDALASDREVLAADGFGDTPLIVIVHGDPAPMIYGPLQGKDLEEAERLYEQAARRLTTLSTNSRYMIADGSGHLVIIEKPELVIHAILSLVDNP